MELDYFLFRSKIKQLDFSEKLQIAPHTLSLIKCKKHVPGLFIALKIYYESGKKVTLESMLSEENMKYLHEKYGVDISHIHEKER